MKENNELMAKFLEYSQDVNNPTFPNTTYWFKDGENPMAVLLFDSDWNQLMKVVHKIRYSDQCSDFNINIYCDCRINCDDYQVEFEVCVYDNGVKNTLDATYQVCVQFIKWYNSLNENTVLLT